MAKVKFKLNRAGVGQLLKGSEMQSILGSVGAQKAAQAGDGYDSDVHVYQKRAVANVYAADAAARKDNLENNTLLKVLK